MKPNTWKLAIQYLITAAIDADSSPSEENEMLLETERMAVLSAILEVEKELRLCQSELKKWNDWPKEYDVLKELRLQANQKSFAAKGAYINGLEFELKHVSEERDALKEAMRWIPVEDKPHNKIAVLGLFEGGWQAACIEGEDGWYVQHFGWKCERPIMYMPLPAVPERDVK